MLSKTYKIVFAFIIFCFIVYTHSNVTQLQYLLSTFYMKADTKISQNGYISIESKHKNRPLFTHVNESTLNESLNCGSLETWISPNFTTLKLINLTKENITVTVFAYDDKNIPKTIGGDVIAIWAQQLNGNGRVSGRVSDNLNGSYTATIPLLWNGLTQIRAKILSSSENTCIRYKALKRYGNIMYTHPWVQDHFAYFQKNTLKYKTVCRPYADVYDYQNICNFTKLNDNSSWYCGSPSIANLSCNDVYKFGSKWFRFTIDDKDTIKRNGYSDITSTLKVDIKVHENKIPTTRCSDIPKDNTWTRNYTSGYFSKTWRPAYCSGPLDHSFHSYRQCLNGKYVAMLGDSTVKQYYNYFCKGRLCVNTINNGQFTASRYERVNQAYNATFLLKTHELPYYHHTILPSGIRSFPSVLKDLADGHIVDDSLIVLITYHAHLTAFRTSVYKFRLSNLVHSIKYLLTKKPRATILFKGPHVVLHSDSLENKWFDPKISLLFRDILFEEFHDIMDLVIYLDIWDVTVTHENEILHPKGKAFESQIQQFMSYICN